jgi:hypothetical protein
MAQGRFVAERIIPAPVAQLYALLADYRLGHPSILPPAFSDFTVLEGGVGTGTRIRFTLTVGGRPRQMEAVVSEPEPGRILAETYQDGSVTSFTVDQVVEGSRLRIETVWSSPRGPAGFIERLLVPRLLGPLYRDELDRIEARALAGEAHR